MKFKDILKLEPLFKNATERDKCMKKFCKDLINAYENERKETAKYMMEYHAKSKAYKKYIKKQDEYRKITDIKEQNRLNKLNFKEYHKTKDYKELNKKINSSINSKIKKQLNQCGFNNCPDLYKKEIEIRLKLYKGQKIKVPKNLKFNDYTNIIKILKK